MTSMATDLTRPSGIKVCFS